MPKDRVVDVISVVNFMGTSLGCDATNVLVKLSHYHWLFLQVSCAFMHSKNWDDLKIVLAVVEAGSVNAAAAKLRVNHATVLRRIAAFEQQYDVRIFDRNARGYRVLPSGQQVIRAIEAVKTSIEAVERAISGQSEQARGVVRLTTADTFSSLILPGIIKDLREREPLISIDMQTTGAHLSLSQLDADITVRPAVVLPPDLNGIAAAKLGFAVYGAAEYVSGLRGQTSPEAQWLTVGTLLKNSLPGQWLAKNVPQARVVGTADSFLTLRDLAKTGLGLVMLPCCVGDTCTRLVRMQNRAPDIVVDIWVATHADMAEVARIKIVRDGLIEGLRDHKAELFGDFSL